MWAYTTDNAYITDNVEIPQIMCTFSQIILTIFLQRILNLLFSSQRMSLSKREFWTYERVCWTSEHWTKVCFLALVSLLVMKTTSNMLLFNYHLWLWRFSLKMWQMYCSTPLITTITSISSKQGHPSIQAFISEW